MATLILRGSTWHLAWRWRGKLKFQSTKVRHDGKTKDGKPLAPAAAKRELRKLESLLDVGRSPERKTLSQLLDAVEKEYEIAGYSSKASLNSRLEHLRDFFGNIRAESITELDFTEYAAHRQKVKNDKAGASNATINRELEVLMKALRIGRIFPLPKLKKLPEAAPRQGFFDDVMIGAVVAALPDYLRAPVLFGYYTGWRREEVFGLEWSAVDFNAGEVRLWDSKNGTQRVFPIDAVSRLRPLLESLTEATKTPIPADKRRVKVQPPTVPANAKFVFARTLKKSKRVRRPVDFRKAWATACEAAGCPGMTFHDLRRSAARNLELAGWPRSMIMAWMGHETEAMFHRYRIQSAADREIVSKLIAARKAAGLN